MAAVLNVVVVEDHDALREITVALLNDHGYQAIGIACAEEVDDTVSAVPVDIYLIDLNLPGEGGISLAWRIRQSHPRVGIIMVTARSQLNDKIAGYENGADLYLPKPVAPEELLSALAALSRRLGPGGTLANGDATAFAIDIKQLRLTGPKGAAVLSASDVAVLAAFSRAPTQRLSAWQLAEAIWGPENDFAKASLEVRLVRLRKKLHEVGAGAECIRAIRNSGYQLCLPIKVY